MKRSVGWVNRTPSGHRLPSDRIQIEDIKIVSASIEGLGRSVLDPKQASNLIDRN